MSLVEKHEGGYLFSKEKSITSCKFTVSMSLIVNGPKRTRSDFDMVVNKVAMRSIIYVFAIK